MKRLIMPLLAGLVLGGCAKNNKFSVEAKINDVGTQNLTVVWRTAPSGTLSVQEVTAVGNSFNFTGSTSEPTLVEVYAGSGARLLQFMAEGGDKIRLSGKGHDLRLSGSKIGERYAEVLNRVYAEPDRTLAVRDYVRANRGDLVSAVLLLGMYDAREHTEEADSLMAMALPEDAPQWLVADWVESVSASLHKADTLASLTGFAIKGDTTLSVGGEHVYVFTHDESQRTAALVDSMRVWKDVVDVYCGGNRASWRTIVAADSASWSQMFVPGGPAALELMPLQLESMPLVLVTDSAGAVVRRFRP